MINVTVLVQMRHEGREAWESVSIQ